MTAYTQASFRLTQRRQAGFSLVHPIFASAQALQQLRKVTGRGMEAGLFICIVVALTLAVGVMTARNGKAEGGTEQR